MEEQQTPPESNALENFFNISLDAGMRAQIRQAAVWAKICTLCAFIGYGISLIVALFGQEAELADTSESVGNMVRAGRIGTILISVIIGGIVNYFLYRFAVATIKGMNDLDTIKTNEGFNNLRVYFKACGILLIIILSLAALFMVVVFASLGGR
jgi:heme/copper-type cytochrome/quinol oxidase subunit 2